MQPPADPFDALHPGNIPAWLEDRYDRDWAMNYATGADYRDLEAMREDRAGYAAEVGYDPPASRQHLPVSFTEWIAVRDHPCWPEYVQQMGDMPAGDAIGFGPWLHGLPSPDRPNSLRPTRPFLCYQYTELPRGWVRGDPESTEVDRPSRQVAYDPRRHMVVRRLGELPTAIGDRMAAAGYRPLAAAGVTYFVRDRTADRRTARHQARGQGRSL